MTCAIMKSMKFCLFNAALLAAMSGSAFAVDGVVLIDQNKALAGGVTPGDAAGFPVTITQPGSYRLSSNLIQPTPNTPVIDVRAGHVTIDLNGFAILGATDCSGGTNPCAGAGDVDGPGDGIRSEVFVANVTIRNGTIQGMGRRGIFLLANSVVIEHMHIRSNATDGIRVSIVFGANQRATLVRYNTVERNGGNGINIIEGLVERNTVSENGGGGIGLSRGSAQYNVSTANLVGINAGTGSYIGNVLDGNQLQAFGVNMGQNVCNGAPCPGAQF
jgi:hypothetical protein